MSTACRRSAVCSVEIVKPATVDSRQSGCNGVGARPQQDADAYRPRRWRQRSSTGRTRFALSAAAVRTRCGPFLCSDVQASSRRRPSVTHPLPGPHTMRGQGTLRHRRRSGHAQTSEHGGRCGRGRRPPVPHPARKRTQRGDAILATPRRARAARDPNRHAAGAGRDAHHDRTRPHVRHRLLDRDGGLVRHPRPGRCARRPAPGRRLPAPGRAGRRPGRGRPGSRSRRLRRTDRSQRQRG